MGQSVITLNKTDAVKGEDNIPQLVYAQNCMPSAKGYKGVGHINSLSADGATTDQLLESAVFPYALTDGVVGVAAIEVKDLATHTASRFWGYDTTVNGFALYDINPPMVSDNLSGEDISWGTVNDTTYVWAKGLGAWRMDKDPILTPTRTGELFGVTFTGLSVADVEGITAANGYLIAWTDDAIAWSSTIDPTDFTPSATTGAGGGPVQDAQGGIVAVYPFDKGIFIYTKRNILMGLYTGNKQYPYKIVPVPNSIGVEFRANIAWSLNTDTHYVSTFTGILAVTASGAKWVLPELFDFIKTKSKYNLNTATYQPIQLDSDDDALQISLIANKYLTIQLPFNGVTPAKTYIYDMSIGKLGILTGAYTKMVELYISAETEGARKARNWLGTYHIYKDPAKSEWTLNLRRIDFMEYTSDTEEADALLPRPESMFLLGRYKYSRSRRTELHEIQVTTKYDRSPGVGIYPVALTYPDYDVEVVPSQNGRDNDTPVVPTLIEDSGAYRRYGVGIECESFLLAFKGDVNIEDVVLVVSAGGRD
jgi:hypothetical protein